MVKNYSNSTISLLSQINEGYLAVNQKGMTALVDNNKQLESSYFSESCNNETKPAYTYPETPILSALENYLKFPTVNLHIPGHGRDEGILPAFKELIGHNAIKADITDDFDGLGQLIPPRGAIKEAQEIAAKTFGAEYTFFLVNGSTIGNIALALTATCQNEKVIVARNCHRSVISGIATSGANPVWVMLERNDKWGIWGSIDPQLIKKALLDNPDTTTVWITNPTYEGVVSDIETIASICKEFNVILIVDEAHGSHWKFNNELPQSAIELGADAVVHSIHKTSGSFSQSSMLHLAKDSKIDYDEMLGNLRILQSTSPSYLLLASLDAARAFIDSDHGRAKLSQMVNYSNIIRNKINKLADCACLTPDNGYNIDPTKIYITIKGISGRKLKDILEYEFHIETEAKTDKGILALASIGNNINELEYLYEVIKNIISRKHIYVDCDCESVKYMPFSIPQMVKLPRDAHFSRKEKVLPGDAVGRISAEIVAVCPPGIPILVPGELIQEDHMQYINGKEFIWVSS